MSILDKFQQAWQSQRCAVPATNPDALLKGVRLERRLTFWLDMSVIGFFFCVGAWMLRSAFRDIHKEWPWLLYTASDAWIVGYMLFNQWRRRRHVARYDEPLLAHVEGSIKDIEHQMWLDRYSPWWYILPIALGCMLPTILLFLMDYRRHHKWGDIFELFSALGIFAVTFIFVYVVMKYGASIANAKRRQELQALRTLRETLLNTEESQV
jgi:hypothetical protein